MKIVRFGRRKFTFGNGKVELINTSITVRSRVGEREEAFTERVLGMIGSDHGTIEIIYRSGRPDYAIITYIT